MPRQINTIVVSPDTFLCSSFIDNAETKKNDMQIFMFGWQQSVGAIPSARRKLVQALDYDRFCGLGQRGYEGE